MSRSALELTHLPSFQCRDCGYDETCVLCAECFDPDAHQGHDFSFMISAGAGGCCDCGDREAWRRPLHCKVHGTTHPSISDESEEGVAEADAETAADAEAGEGDDVVPCEARVRAVVEEVLTYVHQRCLRLAIMSAVESDPDGFVDEAMAVPGDADSTAPPLSNTHASPLPPTADTGTTPADTLTMGNVVIDEGDMVIDEGDVALVNAGTWQGTWETPTPPDTDMPMAEADTVSSDEEDAVMADDLAVDLDDDLDGDLDDDAIGTSPSSDSVWHTGPIPWTTPTSPTPPTSRLMDVHAIDPSRLRDTDPYRSVVLYNDEHHSFQTVIQCLCRAVPGCTPDVARRHAECVDAFGRTVVFRARDVAACRRVARVIRAVGLTVTVSSALGVAMEGVCVGMVRWLTEGCKRSAGFRRVVSEVLVRVRCPPLLASDAVGAGAVADEAAAYAYVAREVGRRYGEALQHAAARSEAHDKATIPTHPYFLALAKASSMSHFSWFLWLDASLWKELRGCLKELYIVSLLMDPVHKKEMARQFIQNYPRVANDYFHTDREVELSVLPFSVQIFTAPSLSTHLVLHPLVPATALAEGQVLRSITALDILIAVLEARLKVRADGLLECDTPFMAQRKYFHVFHDLRYILLTPAVKAYIRRKVVAQGRSTYRPAAEATEVDRFGAALNGLSRSPSDTSSIFPRRRVRMPRRSSTENVVTSEEDLASSQADVTSSEEDLVMTHRDDEAEEESEEIWVNEMQEEDSIFGHFLSFLAFFQGMEPNSRRTGTHIEYESNVWVYAFNMGVQLSKFVDLICDPFQAKDVLKHYQDRLGDARFSASLEMLIVAIKMVIIALGEHFLGDVAYTPFQNYVDPIRKTTISLTSFSVASSPVAFMFPLHWCISSMLFNLVQLLHEWNEESSDVRSLFEVLHENLFPFQLHASSLPDDYPSLGDGSDVALVRKVLAFDLARFFARLVEKPLHTQVLLSQIRCGMWVRNGYAMNNQAINYESVNWRDGMQGRDLFLIQIASLMLGPSYFLRLASSRFDLNTKWFDALIDGQCSHASCPYKDIQDDHLKHFVVGNEDFYLLLVYLIRARSQYCNEPTTTEIRRMLIHRLTLHPCAYTELTSQIPDRLCEHESFDAILGNVATFRFPSATADKGMYELKPEVEAVEGIASAVLQYKSGRWTRPNKASSQLCTTSWDLFYPHYSRADREKAKERLRMEFQKVTPPSSASKAILCIGPAPLQPCMPTSISLDHTDLDAPLSTDVFISMLCLTLIRYRDDKRMWQHGDTLLDVTIYLIQLAIIQMHDNKVGWDTLMECFSVTMSIRHVSGDSEDVVEESLGSVIIQLMKDERFEEYRGTLQWIIHHVMMHPSKSAVGLAFTNEFQVTHTEGEGHGDKGSKSASSAAEKKKRKAAKRKASVMAKLAKQQANFMANFGSDEDVEAGKEGLEEERSDGDSEEVWVDAEEEILAEKQQFWDQIEPWKPEEGNCLVCQEACSDRSDPWGFLGMAVKSRFIRSHRDHSEFSRVLKHQPGISPDVSEESNEPEMEYYITTCGHMMHQKCFKEYLKSSNARARRNMELILRRTGRHVRPPDDSKFSCPLCKSFGNILLPYVGASSNIAYIKSKDSASLMETCFPFNLTPLPHTDFPTKTLFRSYENIVDMAKKISENITRDNGMVKSLIGDIMSSGKSSPSTEGNIKESLPERVKENMPRMKSLMGSVGESVDVESYRPDSARYEKFLDLYNYCTQCKESADRIGRVEPETRQDRFKMIGNDATATADDLPSDSKIRGTSLRLLSDLALMTRIYSQEGNIADMAFAILKGIIGTGPGDPLLFSDLEKTLAKSSFLSIPFESPAIFHDLIGLLYCAHVLRVINGIFSYHIRPGIEERNESDSNTWDSWLRILGIGKEVDDWTHFGNILDTYCLPFLSYSASILENYFNVILPGDIKQEFSIKGRANALRRFLYLPTTWEEFRSWSMQGKGAEIMVSWINEVKGRKDIPKLADPWPFELIDLPPKMEQLFERYARKKCKSCGTIPNDPAVCLICGELICSQSFCCMKDGVGGCNMHMATCTGEVGMFLMIQKCVVTLLHDGKGCFINAPYLDTHGEPDIGLRRGKNLFLYKSRYDYLRKIWIERSIPSIISQKQEQGYSVDGWEAL